MITGNWIKNLSKRVPPITFPRETSDVALQRYLRVARLHRLRAKLVPHAQARVINTDEDVFRALGEL